MGGSGREEKGRGEIFSCNSRKKKQLYFKTNSNVVEYCSRAFVLVTDSSDSIGNINFGFDFGRERMYPKLRLARLKLSFIAIIRRVVNPYPKSLKL